MKTLTVSEAIEQGFELCGYSNLEWQHGILLTDVESDEFKDDELVLFSKESSHYSIDESYLKDVLSDRISEDEAEATGREDSDILDAISEIDFSDITKVINTKLTKFKYWKLTDITLIH